MGTETEAKLKVEEVLSNKENEVVELTTRVTELKLNREEIEESLLDTQVQIYTLYVQGVTKNPFVDF